MPLRAQVQAVLCHADRSFEEAPKDMENVRINKISEELILVNLKYIK